ncbi:MAG: 4-amino-4-deoxy-L-arabinose transferase [Nocardioidaceae bacterium]
MLLPELVAQVLSSPSRLPGSRLVCLDGRAGAGKTSLADELAAGCTLACPGQVSVLHLDDLYAGWSGLPDVADLVATSLVAPWRRGLPGYVATWDWHRGVRREPVPQVPTSVILLEGVGSYARRYADAISSLIWVESPEPVRRARALARDGRVFAAHWDRWAADEEFVHAREGTRSAADVVVDTGLVVEQAAR